MTGKQKIQTMIQLGRNFKEIAYETGYSIAYVYRINHEIGGQKKYKSNEEVIGKLKNIFEKQGINPIKAQVFSETLVSKFEAKRNNALREGHEFTLDLLKMEIPIQCPVFGIPLDYDCGWSRHPNNPTFDRVDPTKGYSLENTRIISWLANRKKQDSTITDLEQILSYIKINS